jgi:hypothetical protein
MTDARSHDARLEFKGNLVRDFKEYVYTHHMGYPSPEGFVKWYNEKQKRIDEETEILRKKNEEVRLSKGM